ncbi:ribosome biogenesis/translation initiation ATPase RLI [Candidatus Woesearchaeota archaeon]|nr:ribosome biogenesis/translation initiation ATPase RLI [Candidatus Woesearchaeota archaeon]
MKRIAVIDKEKCNPVGCGGYLCIRVSPGNRMGNEVFVVGADGKAQVNEDVCTDAESVTVKKCPFNAIHMVKLPDKLASQPVHRYGRDGFILYRLPTPMFGSVVGILGVNAIGKSTAVKILSRVLSPNLGKDKSDFSELLSYFKGSEAQLFFERLSKGQIAVSYKPQSVELIPKQFSGKVRDLLERADERKQLKDVVKSLDIGEIMDSGINQLSGGELQRVAIAAASLKKANVYFFDEPSSFLDISQRIKASRFIRGLADGNTAVVVVEHDLVILDYMADQIHIMYGEAGAYGICSQVKATRNAINTYLSGYLKEENVKFRDHEIKFSARAPEKLMKSEPAISWENVKKKLGNFTLVAESGEIPRKQVVGIVGPNGIGKTTFAKLLAGVEKADSGSISSSVKVSYKPQYLDFESGQLVESVLDVDSILSRQLNLGPLMKAPISTLSGGELQRVAIADCLSKNADLYLLDEPSAYLDVEQRLVVSKVIRERMELSGKTALVIEHDLVFVDYLSDSLIVFEGTPARLGSVHGSFSMEEGMNRFLTNLKITLRRDPDSLRPRINKPGSRLDEEQRRSGRMYYQ